MSDKNLVDMNLQLDIFIQIIEMQQFVFGTHIVDLPVTFFCKKKDVLTYEEVSIQPTKLCQKVWTSINKKWWAISGIVSG